VQYPVACRPQAWASGAALLMVRSYGGLSADAPGGRLYINRPRLPEWLERMEVRGMRIGEARLDLVFTNRGGGHRHRGPPEGGGDRGPDPAVTF
jgi:hypothetical protein